MTDYVISFKNVSIDYEMKNINLHAVSDVSLNLERGKITALVGESGSGKTTLASALLDCISKPGRVVSGSILMYSRNNDDVINITALNEHELNKFRWKKIAMVFQGAQSSLNPVTTIFQQFYETIIIHGEKLSKKEARLKFINLLNLVNLSPRILDSYPHEISGGMKQRVMIAFALLLNPEVIILDEPTTALDVITQSYIFSLLKKINEESKTTMLLLTHDIAVVAEYVDNIGVMYGGKLLEFGTVKDVFKNRYHPYTEGLIFATPSIIDTPYQIRAIPGSPLDITQTINGCPFAPRCAYAIAQCQVEIPKNNYIDEFHFVKCHLQFKGGKRYV
jgi:peptide/nickel transport system ATP-binding protein